MRALDAGGSADLPDGRLVAARDFAGSCRMESSVLLDAAMVPRMLLSPARFSKARPGAARDKPSPLRAGRQCAATVQTWNPPPPPTANSPQGLLYWRGERALCAGMAANPAIPAAGHGLFALEDLHATSCSKSFDYRVLHHLACHLAARPPPSPDLLDFLALDEWLVDIGDDLVDYEDDVERWERPC